MAWEPIDAWPGDGGGEGAFRASSEPVLAERGAPTGMERLRLWWHSTPELPIARVARRAAVTSQFVYVERRDGGRERAPRARLRGVRRVGARLIFGVIDGEDLVLPHRPGCPLQRTLLGQLGGDADEAWTGWHDVALGAILGAVGAPVGAVLLASHPLSSFRLSIEAGLWTSENALGFYGGWAALLVGVAAMAWIPSRIRVDRLGLEVRRGLIPWLPFFCPAEELHLVRVREVIGNRNGPRRVLGYEVVAVFPEVRRFASMGRRWAVRVGFFSTASSGDGRALNEAMTLARRAGKLLGVEVLERPR